MNTLEIESIVQKQQAFFASGATIPVNFRIQQLKKLRLSIKHHEKTLMHALKLDLGKSATESYMCEIGLTLSEINWMLRHIRSLARRHYVSTPFSQFAAISYQAPSPYGTVLIMSPWNYPVLLTLEPLIDAIAAGNTVICKPSAYATHTSALLYDIISECFPPEYVTVVTGGRTENQTLLDQHFDKIFFTGSKPVGQEVMKKASAHLTPVTLELGGKSPCIVDSTAKLSLAAKRIVFGKFLNCGQTCVAPDYILCEESIKQDLITALKQEIFKQFGEHPLENETYGNIIHERHYQRLLALIDSEKTIFGGQTQNDTLRIAPTIMDSVTLEDPIMQEEIFGPILPILTYQNLEEALRIIQTLPQPLALYIFSENHTVQRFFLSRCRFGGGCINDTISHLANCNLPFGGVGESGMGAYHGKAGFDEFTHYGGIMDKKTWFDFPFRYQAYTTLKEKIIRLFLH